MLRPFTAADITWVYEVSLDPALQHFVQVPSPYRIEHAAFFVRQVAIAGWDSGQRAEFVAQEAATGARLGRVGLGLRQPGAAEIGYWVDPVPVTAASRPARCEPSASGLSPRWAWSSSSGAAKPVTSPPAGLLRRPGFSLRQPFASG